MYNFLCVGGSKYGCDLFTEGSNGKIVTVEEALSDTSLPLCWAGSHKETLYHHCIENDRKFYNLDTGYFGNVKRKEIIRVTYNNFQDMDPVVSRSDDRLKDFSVEIENYPRGSSIVIVPPDEKIIKSFQLGNSWVEKVESELKKYTDRPIRIRHRPLSRSDRVNTDTFKDFIKKDTFAVVGFSSNALVESIICGIPVISLGHSATKSLCDYDLKDIEKISDLDDTERFNWLKHLSYRQFTHEELQNGTAWKLLNESLSVGALA